MITPDQLIPPGRLDAILWTMIVLSALTLIVATANFITSMKRLRQASSVLDKRTVIIAKGVLRAGIGGILVSIAGILFTWQAIAGEFNLINNWFSYLFLAAIFSGPLNCLVQGISDRRDRLSLDHLSEKG